MSLGNARPVATATHLNAAASGRATTWTRSGKAARAVADALAVSKGKMGLGAAVGNVAPLVLVAADSLAAGIGVRSPVHAARPRPIATAVSGNRVATLKGRTVLVGGPEVHGPRKCCGLPVSLLRVLDLNRFGFDHIITIFPGRVCRQCLDVLLDDLRRTEFHKQIVREP